MSASKKTIGVLALQGDFVEHVRVLRSLQVQVCEVRLPADLQEIHGLIIPGGESTVIGRLLHEWKLWQAIRDQVKQENLAIWGTCAGAILLAQHVPNLEVEGLRLMDISVDRNAFGRQVDSFTAALKTAIFEEKSFPGVFIRAPIITELGKGAQAVAWLEDSRIVAAQQGKLLATAFHPELTADTRFHEYFLSMLNTK